MTKNEPCQHKEELSFTSCMTKHMRLTYHLRGAHLGQALLFLAYLGKDEFVLILLAVVCQYSGEITSIAV